MADAVKKFLVTGGAGYIGGHTVLQLLQKGGQVVVVDNLDNSTTEGLKRVREISGCAEEALIFIQADLCDEAAVEAVFSKYTFLAVIHFAGKKAVGESVAKPLLYYSNNLSGTLILLEAMGRHGCKKLIFSSSATVYGNPEKLPITEDLSLSATNPYGQTKLWLEDMMRALYHSDKEWDILLLRYFNPVGNHPSGKIGEDPSGKPNNLMPFVAQVASGKREKLSVFGGDWDTPDGTGVRDYIHVEDLAAGHIKALEKLQAAEPVGCVPVNLGTGNGYSVLEMLAAMGKACGRDLPYEISPRRPGDVASCYCDPKLAKEYLGWEATRNLETMCADLWQWQSSNPNGYQS